MCDVAIDEIADMQQSVDSAQIDERPVVGQILYHAGDDGSFVQTGERFDFACGKFALE